MALPSAPPPARRRLSLVARHVSAGAEDAGSGAEGHATPEGTARAVLRLRRLAGATGGGAAFGRELGSTGLLASPVGFGTHRMEDGPEHREALRDALLAGCNVIDTAPNYMDGRAEAAVGTVLAQLFAGGQLQRSEVVVATKVGNVVGDTLRRVQQEESSGRPRPGMAKVRDDVWHCIHPYWIHEEISGSLRRLRLGCLDAVLLHCPEFQSSSRGVDIEEVYRRLGAAFAALEDEVEAGRCKFYGLSAAFYPLRRESPEHLDLRRVLQLLPAGGGHFRFLQFPLNFAEPQPLWARHGAGPGTEPLLALAKQHGLATLTNRPLDGIYKSCRGRLRFTSAGAFDSELGPEDAAELEAKLTRLCPKLRAYATSEVTADSSEAGESHDNHDDDDNDFDGLVEDEFAVKSLRVVASVEGVDCTLVGMRLPAYVHNILPAFARPDALLQPAQAREAMRTAHSSIEMWLCMAAEGEEDHGTAKDWRLTKEESQWKTVS